MNWSELRDFLNKLGDDPRMEDRVIIYHVPSGDELPCTLMESEDDNPITSEDQLLLMAFDWGQLSMVEGTKEDIELD